MVSEDQYGLVNELVDDALSSGAARGRENPRIPGKFIAPTVLSSSTPERTVGAMNLPGNPGISRDPPATRSAPLDSASSTSSFTSPYWSSETMGPISVSHSIGSPTAARWLGASRPR